MNKFLFLCLAVTLAILFLSHGISGHNIPQQTPAQQEDVQNQRKVQIVKDIRTFIVQNPELRLIRLNKKEPVNRLQTVKYLLGDRVEGDRMVAQFGDSLMHSSAQNITSQVTYPAVGTGSMVSFVEINCLQDHNEGNAYVVAGGIGQPYISIVLEATQTERFSYNVHVFGKN